MNREYYYLAASLPYLKFREEPPFTMEQFLEECEKWLSGKDMQEIRESLRPPVREVSGSGRQNGGSFSPVLREWITFNSALKNDIAAYREERKKGGEKKPSGEAGKILEAGDPLEMELYFEKVRWEFLDDLAAGRFFDIGKLIVYCVQLSILERLAKFEKDKGETFFHEICEVKYEYASG
jgi:hypothetical protein